MEIPIVPCLFSWTVGFVMGMVGMAILGGRFRPVPTLPPARPAPSRSPAEERDRLERERIANEQDPRLGEGSRRLYP